MGGGAKVRLSMGFGARFYFRKGILLLLLLNAAACLLRAFRVPKRFQNAFMGTLSRFLGLTGSKNEWEKILQAYAAISQFSRFRA